MSNIKMCFESRYGDKGVIMEADFCLTPHTKVLTHNFKYKEIKDVQIGEELVGFEDTLRKYNRTQFKKATVVGKKVLRKKCLEFIFDDGTSISGSVDHSWVAVQKSKGNSLLWSRMDELSVGDYIPQVCEVWEDLSNTPDGA